MSSQKLSLLVGKQLPSYVREEYPKFQSFLEAYYEFLENKQGTQTNDLLAKAQTLKDLSNVDESIDEFEDYFMETFMRFIPKDAVIDKAYLLKNILPLYLTKGSEKSFKFLFRALYNKEIEFRRPSENILRASDGTWIVDNKLRISKNFFSYYEADGVNKRFDLILPVSKEDITVTINGTEQNPSTYYTQKEYLRLVFITAPAAGAEVEVYYKNFTSLNPSQFASRKITGEISGATTITEKIVEENINDLPVFSLFTFEKNVTGKFKEGERVLFDIFNNNGVLVKIKAQTISILRTINIINGGSGYNVGDVVIVFGGGATTPATAIVSQVFAGSIEKIVVTYGGAGFKPGSDVLPIGFPPEVLRLAIEEVDAGGYATNLSPNTFVISPDIIETYKNTLLSSTDYLFPAIVVPAETISTVIADALSNTAFTGLGPITSVALLSSNGTFSSPPPLNALGASTEFANTTFYINDYGSLGRFKINAGGTGYAVGDEILFTNRPGEKGLGAAAAVTKVASNGMIQVMEFQPYRVSGTANTTANSAIVIGTGTLFLSELRVGAKIMINNQVNYVSSVSSDTYMVANNNFSFNTTNKKVGNYDLYLVGGQGYEQDALPTTVVSSPTGNGANVVITSILGDGEILTAQSSKQSGEILVITITNPGNGYLDVPQIDLSQSGDGNATANAQIENPYISLPGRFVTSDGLLSSEETRLESGNYYHDYSYVISTQIEFSRYKNVIKQLLHPAGFQEHGEWSALDVIINTRNFVDGDLTNPGSIATISGYANGRSNTSTITSNTINFTGAANNQLISNGSIISVNNEIVVISNIVNSNTITVTPNLTSNIVNSEIIVIIMPISGIGGIGAGGISTEEGIPVVREEPYVPTAPANTAQVGLADYYYYSISTDAYNVDMNAAGIIVGSNVEIDGYEVRVISRNVETDGKVYKVYITPNIPSSGTAILYRKTS